ncbi:hypothetical protein P5673_009021 [Acropora cervicornis]|uniref:HAT C-terminal dimerisation domain-containing protein n=1 Tax=Acropora cervicornis TaxID=6130 RepID=A0AAD9QTQ2_ACRCE|nr:hypothetical protein P5673_009021 [Acropora cervicornis]
MELSDWSLTVSKDAEMKTRIPGVKSMMTTFDFYFGCTLGEQLLRQTGNLGRTVAPCKIHPPQLLKGKTTEIQTIEGPKLPNTVTQCIATRFEQEDFKIYVNIQELLLKSFASERCDTELAEVVKTYSGDLDSFKLKDNFCFYHRKQSQWGLITSEFDVNDLAIFLQSLHISRRKLLSEISTLGKLLLVMPAINAVGERSFSAFRRGKTYLSSTTGDS